MGKGEETMKQHNPPPSMNEVSITKEQPDTVIAKEIKDDMYNYTLLY